MKIYIAGPYSLDDPIINTRNVILAAEKIIELGHIPFVPHLNLLWHLVVPHPPEFWYKLDLEWLKECDAILRLDGESQGSDNEILFAERLELKIFYSVKDIPNGKAKVKDNH